MELIDYINSKVRLTPEECEEVDKAFHVEHHCKATILIQPDSLSQKVMFVERGLLRTLSAKTRNGIAIDGRFIDAIRPAAGLR
jgi:hypothetical protein